MHTHPPPRTHTISQSILRYMVSSKKITRNGQWISELYTRYNSEIFAAKTIKKNFRELSVIKPTRKPLLFFSLFGGECVRLCIKRTYKLLSLYTTGPHSTTGHIWVMSPVAFVSPWLKKPWFRGAGLTVASAASRVNCPSCMRITGAYHSRCEFIKTHELARFNGCSANVYSDAAEAASIEWELF